MLTLPDVQRAAPPGIRKNLTQNVVDALNTVSLDPEAAESVRENFVTYLTVLKDGRFKIEDYMVAVTYVSFKLMGYTNKEAYEKTFPQRYNALIARGASSKDIAAYVSAYNKNKLVTMIAEQAAIPAWILNQDAYQQAINTQVSLMNDASVSNKVRCDAANSILTHLKRPEATQVDLNMTVTETAGMVELKNMLADVAEKQLEAIESGASTQSIAHQRLRMRGEEDDIIDVTPENRATPTTNTKP